MDKTKLIPLLFLIIIGGLGFVAYRFYSENQILIKKSVRIESAQAELSEKYGTLNNKVGQLETEKADLENRNAEIEAALSRLEMERNELKVKVEDISRERNLLAEKLKSRPAVEIIKEIESPQGGEETETLEKLPENYWIDFVKVKAELEVKVSELTNELATVNTKLLDAEKTEKEVSIIIDQLKKNNSDLERQIKFKERTISIMSRDLVSERESRRESFVELEKLREDNTALKREAVLLNKERARLQTELNTVTTEKENAQLKMAEMKNILREKTLVLEEMQEQLVTAFTEGEKIIPKATTSVELPPIVVEPKPSAREPNIPLSKEGLRGEVIAVNQEEKFIIIDIGEIQGVSSGQELSVMRQDKKIASIEVIEVRKEISAADIKEVLDSSGIQEGDTVISK